MQEEERRELVVGGMRVSEIMITSVVRNDSKTAPCWILMPPIEKQHMSGMSTTLTNNSVAESRTLPNFIFLYNFIIKLCNSNQVTSNFLKSLWCRQIFIHKPRTLI